MAALAALPLSSQLPDQPAPGLRVAPAMERHYRVRELASMWKISANTVISLLANEPGVLNVGTGKKRVLSVPESVAVRVHDRWTAQRVVSDQLKSARPRRSPLRVIRLRDLNRRVPKKPRHIVEADISEQLANGKRVA